MYMPTIQPRIALAVVLQQPICIYICCPAIILDRARWCAASSGDANAYSLPSCAKISFPLYIYSSSVPSGVKHLLRCNVGCLQQRAWGERTLITFFFLSFVFLALLLHWRRAKVSLQERAFVMLTHSTPKLWNHRSSTRDYCSSKSYPGEKRVICVLLYTKTSCHQYTSH